MRHSINKKKMQMTATNQSIFSGYFFISEIKVPVPQITQHKNPQNKVSGTFLRNLSAFTLLSSSLNGENQILLFLFSRKSPCSNISQNVPLSLVHSFAILLSFHYLTKEWMLFTVSHPHTLNFGTSKNKRCTDA